MKKFNYYCLLVAIGVGFLNTISSYSTDMKSIDTEFWRNIYTIFSLTYCVLSLSMFLYTLKYKYKEMTIVLFYICTSTWGVMSQYCIPSGYLTFVIASFFFSLFYGINFFKQSSLIIFFALINLYAVETTDALNKMSELKNQFQFDYSATIFLFAFIITTINYFKNKQTKEKELIENKFIDAGSRTSIFVHDLKNLSFPIKTHANFLSKKTESILLDENIDNKTKFNKLKTMIDEINDCSKKMSDYILEFNQAVAFKNEVVKIDLEDIVSLYKKMYQNKLSHVSFKINQESNLNYDLNIFKSIISNLLVNSGDAFIEKQIQNPEICIDLIGKKLIYKDNAGGIPQEKLSMIQNDEFFSSKKQGSGIGIFTMKKYLNLTGGSISFENKNNGLCVTIKF